MNDEIRAAVQARLEQKHLSRSDLARLIGKHPNAVTRALNGLPDGGKVPPIWAAILEALDLDLTVSPKKASGEDRKPGEEKAQGGA